MNTLMKIMPSKEHLIQKETKKMKFLFELKPPFK